MKTGTTLWGVLRYEFLMQIRRPALWLTFLICALLDARTMMGRVAFYETVPQLQHLSTLQWAAFLAELDNWIAPLSVGILLADRLTRDRRVKVEELLNALPGSLSVRIVGKYLGTLLAALIPSFILYLVSTSIATWQLGNPGLLPAFLFCYIVIVLPGMCLIAAFSLALPTLIWVPLYQFLFLGYWFWGNILAPGYGLPTISGTILTPIGSAITVGLFRVSAYGQDLAVRGFWPSPAVYGLVSLVTMVGIAVLVLIALYRFLTLQQARQ